MNLGDLDEIEAINYSRSDNISIAHNESRTQLNCSQREDDLHLIDNLQLEPKLNLTFSSKDQTQFKVIVDYDLIKVQLIVNAKHCNGRIKLNQQDGRSVNVSLSLGIGMNRIIFHVLNDLDTFEQSKTYQIIIQRLSLEEVSRYDESNEQFICQIKQVSFDLFKLIGDYDLLNSIYPTHHPYLEL